MNDNKKISYKNTLIYTIVTAIVSLLILALLFIPSMFDYIYFIAVIELGIFIIIGVCIYKIINFEKNLNKLRDQDTYYIPFSECADYFVKKNDTKGNTYCSNEYTVKDQYGNDKIMKIYPNTKSLPDKHNNTTIADITLNTSDKHDKYSLNQIPDSKLLKTNQQKCSVLFVEPTATNLAAFTGYTEIPWTYLRGRCETFY
jgi:hypothetical protein